MGEYIQLNGADFKLGICEDLYNIRHTDLADAIRAGRTGYRPGNCRPEEYLKPGWRFRFPFPDEDGQEPGTYANFDRGLLVGVPPEFYGPDFEHHAICHSISAGGAYNVNTWTPCPASPAFLLNGRRSSPMPPYYPLEIVRQKTMEGGELWPVCRCGWCGYLFRLPEQDAAKLAEWIERGYIANEREEGRRQYWAEVCRRLMSGFARSDERAIAALVDDGPAVQLTAGEAADLGLIGGQE